jgi:N-dimethylarginine dimethylaminohydrolase
MRSTTFLDGAYRMTTASTTSAVDCVMGLVREGLLVVYEDGLIDGLPRALKDWERIPAAEAEAMSLGANGLSISPDAYVADPAFRRIGDGQARNRCGIRRIQRRRVLTLAVQAAAKTARLTAWGRSIKRNNAFG